LLQPGPKLAGAACDELRGRRVLLVEDNEINQLVALEMLKGLEMQVTVVNTGEEAIHQVKTGAFELVLMDIQMPGMDGYQATAEIRRDPRFGFQNLPVIAMTAHALVGDRERTLQAGMNDHISKPVDLAHLTGVLQHWLLPQSHERRPVTTSGRLSVSLQDHLEALDVKGALVRLGDNQKFYQRLLLLFRDEHTGSVKTLRAALQAGDQDLALRLAHSLKGVAGAIGADMLAGAAKRLEAAIRAQQVALYADWLARTDEELAKVLAAIETAMPELSTVE
jgi:CheY-like chemotaxis protein